MNLDEYEETNVSSNESQLMVKIKEEPKYEGYEDDEDDGFEEVGTFEADPTEIYEEASGMSNFHCFLYLLIRWLNFNQRLFFCVQMKCIKSMNFSVTLTNCLDKIV